MIRFRVGQSWKRETSAPPVDSFGLVLDSVDVLSGASEETLGVVVPEALAAIAGLARQGKRFGHFSLPEAHLEVLLRRRATDEVSLTVVSLARPARLVKGPLPLDLSELCIAAARCGKALAEDLQEHSPKTARSARIRQMQKNVTALARGTVVENRIPPHVASGFSYHAMLPGPVGFGFELYDDEDLLLQLERGGLGALHTLLCPGELTLRLAATGPAQWTGRGIPFLLALELTRQAQDLWHAIETGERVHTFSPGGVGTPVRVDLSRQRVTFRGVEALVEPRQLVSAMFQLGLELPFAMGRRNKSQAKNPYLVELTARSKEGLSHFPRIRPTVAPGEARAKRKARTSAQPLSTKGKLRKLHFSPLWEKHALGGESSGRILLGRLGPIFSSMEMACAFTREGELLFRRVATHGVAASSDGFVLATSAEKVLGFAGPEASARWLRDHDGIPVGPELEHHENTLLAQSDGRGALAFCKITGRELWRVIPPRTQHAFFSVQGHRGLLATDSGYLYGLDVEDGQVRYRMRAAVPFLGPTVPLGKKLLATVGRGGNVVIFCADAHAGALLWTQELELDRPTAPVAGRERIVIAGEREGNGVVLCLSSQGSTLWERTLQIGRGPYAVSMSPQGVLVSSLTGESEFLGPEGQVQWRLGAVNRELAHPLPAVWARGIAIIPGERVRAVDPRGGRVLSEIVAGAGLVDLKVDSKLNVYLLDDECTLKAYKLATHLAVVNGTPAP
jgi:hypothetical protein